MAQTKAQLLGPVVGDVVMDVSTLSLDAAGNKVGIGTTGATATLHVFEPTEGDAVVQFNSGDNFPTVNRGLVLKAATGPTGYTGSKWIFDAQSSGGRLEFQTASTPRLTILESGNTGIGIDNPVRKLHVSGSATQQIRLENTAASGNSVLELKLQSHTFDIGVNPTANYFSDTADLPYVWYHSSGERLRIDYSGRLLKSGQAALTSTSLSHPIQVAAASDANAIAIVGRASDDIGELSFYEADKTTKLGELQYRQDHVNFRCRVGDIRFASGGTSETLRIDGSGRIAQGGKTPTNHGSPNLLLWGADPTMMIASTGSTNNSSYTGIKFAVAGGSTGDYSKAGIFVQRQDSYNDLDMIFAFRSTNDAAGVAISDEKLRINSDGNVGIGTANPAEKLHVQGDIRLVDNSPRIGFHDANAADNLSCTGGIELFDSAGNRGAYMGATEGSNFLSFGISPSAGAAPTEKLRITSGGQVNIGGDLTQTGFTANITRNSTETDILRIKGNSGNAFIRFQDSDSSSNYTLGADDAVGSGGFTLYDRNASAYRLIIDDNGRILKGMTASLLGSSDVQLTGSGGPAKIAGYKSDNNPTANNSMLTVTGYSQSGGTFTGIGEIDIRVDQNSNTASGHHPGSIVMRVNGGSTTGTYNGYAYSYAGLKDRERITLKAKRYYCLPEFHGGNDTYNNFREEWDYQHAVGYNQYSWYRFTSHSSSSSRGGSVDIRVTWSTRHAAGNGYGHYAFHWRDSHATGYMEIGNVYKYHQNHLSGSYYGWASSPQLDVYEINDNGNVAGFYLRLQGHVQANSSTYDGGVMHQFTISTHSNRYGADVNKFEFVGNSTPSDVGSIQGNNNLP